MRITITVTETVRDLLAVLDEKGSAAEAVQLLVDHAQQGVYRPGSWERPWLCQAFGEEWMERVEAGDPYGRPGAGYMFDRPKRGSMPEKNPAAVTLGLLGGNKGVAGPDAISAAASSLGALGGRKGGFARAAGMTPEERSESARKAAAGRMTKMTPQQRRDVARKAIEARWKKTRGSE